MSGENTKTEFHRSQKVQIGIKQQSGLSYWNTQIGMTVPHVWQAPQNTQLATGIWPHCGVWKRGGNGGLKSGGETVGVLHSCGRGWESGELAPVWELGVKIGKPPVETPSLGQFSPSFSSFTLCDTPCSRFFSGIHGCWWDFSPGLDCKIFPRFKKFSQDWIFTSKEVKLTRKSKHKNGHSRERFRLTDKYSERFFHNLNYRIWFSAPGIDFWPRKGGLEKSNQAWKL